MKEFVRYLVASAIGHLTWEIAQLPLYTIWSDGTPGLMAWAIVHCTGGDLLIAASCFALARPISGRWLAALLVASGVAYTILSE